MSVPSRAASVSLSGRSARWSGCRSRRSIEVGSADDDARLRAAQQLVARERRRRARRSPRSPRAVGSSPTSTSAPGAEVVHEHEAVPLRDARELLHPRLLGEADDAEVGLVHPQEDGRPLADRALVVGQPGAVGRAHLDEPRAGAREDVGDAEAVADLDQLATGDDHLASLRQRGEREQDGRGVVVDDERGLGSGQLPEQLPPTVILARAARPRRPGRTRGSSSRRRPRRRGRARRRRAARARGSCARRSPVAFSTRRRFGRVRAFNSCTTRPTRSGASKPARISSRARARADRAAARTSGRP